MEIEAKVHMLPTEDGVIFLNRATGTLVTSIPNVAKKLYPAQHLYITTDEEIKEGDWYLMNMKYPTQSASGEVEKGNYDNCRKIIATTDPRLYTTCTCALKDSHGIECGPLPQIPQSFIEDYCKAGGIDKVMVEYEEWTTMYRGMANYKLKTDSNNCIIIHPVEEKVYSREEVEDLIHKFNMEQAGFPWVLNDTLKWIKENL